jgi:hypothetical protein
MASESHFKTIQQLTCFVMKYRVKSIFFTSDIVLTSVSRVLFMPASENNLKLKNIFSSFFFKFRKGIVFSTFWSQKSISKKLFSEHDKWTAAVLNINSASKVLEKNTFFIIKMGSETCITQLVSAPSIDKHFDKIVFEAFSSRRISF